MSFTLAALHIAIVSQIMFCVLSRLVQIKSVIQLSWVNTNSHLRQDQVQHYYESEVHTLINVSVDEVK